MVRGYANLGLLTEFHWHPMHKVFKARSLVYAQRMLAADPPSCPARWHRAYAFAATGLHALAIEDFEAAEAAWKEAKKERREKRPGWVDLIDAHCRFDLDRLKPEKADKHYVQLAGLLRISDGGTRRRRDDDHGDGPGTCRQDAGVLSHP